MGEDQRERTMLDRGLTHFLSEERPGVATAEDPEAHAMLDLVGEPDEELARRLLVRDFEAFTLLYDRHTDAVYGMAVYMLGRDEAEEAVQEVFLRLWKRRDRYEPGRGAFRPWLLSLARHHFLDLLRHRAVERRLQAAKDMEKQLAALEDDSPDAADHAWRRQRAVALRRALATIPEEQRKVIVLSYFAGLSQSTIARELETPLGTVKKRVQLGMRKLRASLEQLEMFDDETNEIEKGVR
jgi:RNA polymerase sigma-70 factor (ECF subfamily)